MKCRKEQDTVKGDGEKEGERKGEEEKIAREGSCKREEASGAARTLWEALVLGEKWNNIRPGSGWPPHPVKNCILGGEVLFCLDPALVLAQKPSRHLPTAPDSDPTCSPRITRDGMDVYDL